MLGIYLLVFNITFWDMLAHKDLVAVVKELS